MNIEFANSKKQEKEIKALPPALQKEVFRALETLQSFPASPHCKKLHGMPNAFRIRTHHIRILFSYAKEQKKMIVFKIGQRKDVYK